MHLPLFPRKMSREFPLMDIHEYGISQVVAEFWQIKLRNWARMLSKQNCGHFYVNDAFVSVITLGWT